MFQSPLKTVTEKIKPTQSKSGISSLKFERASDFKKFIGFIKNETQELEKISPGLVEESPPDKFEIKHNSAFGTLYTSDDEETKPVLYTDSDDIPEGYKVGDTKEGASKLVGDVKEVKSQVKSVKYSVLYMKALKALQEAMIRIETLETKVKALEDA